MSVGDGETAVTCCDKLTMQRRLVFTAHKPEVQSIEDQKKSEEPIEEPELPCCKQKQSEAPPLFQHNKGGAVPQMRIREQELIG